MGLKWNMGADVDEGTLKVEVLSVFLKASAPQPGSAQPLVGTGSQASNQLSSSTLYVITSLTDFHIVSSGAVPTATTTDQVWPHEKPYYHFVQSGVNDFVAVLDASGGMVPGAITASIAQVKDI